MKENEEWIKEWEEKEVEEESNENKRVLSYYFIHRVSTKINKTNKKQGIFLLLIFLLLFIAEQKGKENEEWIKERNELLQTIVVYLVKWKAYTVGVKSLHTPDKNMFHLIFCKIIDVCWIFSSLRWLNMISTISLWNNFHHYSVLKNFWGLYCSYCMKSGGQKFTYTYHKIML